MLTVGITGAPPLPPRADGAERAALQRTNWLRLMEPWNGEEGLVLKSDFDRPQSVAVRCPADEVFGKVTGASSSLRG